MKFRKKPVIIDAIRWDEKDETVTSLNELGILGKLFFKDNAWFVSTLEGPLKVSLGDWIIKGIKGEFYPCKTDVFEATYELVQ